MKTYLLYIVVVIAVILAACQNTDAPAVSNGELSTQYIHQYDETEDDLRLRKGGGLW